MIGKICGTGSYLPDYIIDNFKLAESVDTSDEWIQERTGIRQRHIAKKTRPRLIWLRWRL